MKRRLVSLVLAGTLTAGLLSGCGGSGGTAQSGESGASASGENGEPVKIVLEWLYFDSQPKDLDIVEDAINELTIPEINVEVELYPIGFMDAETNIPLMISGGDQLDLIVSSNRSSFLSLVNRNMLLSLDDLYEEYGPNIKEETSFVIPGGYVGDTLYGIPSYEKYGQKLGLAMKKEVTDAIGWDKFEDVTMEDLTDLLSQAKEAFPDKTLIQVAGGGGNVAMFEYFQPVDYLGADAACGGIMGVGADTDDTIINVFATEEYAKYCQTMRDWYLAGYFNGDCATSTDSGQAAVTAGTAESYFIQTELDMVDQQAAANGCEMVGITTRGHVLMQNDINAQLWSIPMTCENPEAAMKLLNMMYESEDLLNLLYYGIEGVDYQFMDDGSGRITYMDGENAQTCGFHMWFGLYGDVKKKLIWDGSPADYKEQLVVYNGEVGEDNTSKYLGYNFNPDEMSTQYSAVTDVITTYRTALECGAVDPAEVLPQFLDALESAGINDIIAKNQADLDAWLAEQE